MKIQKYFDLQLQKSCWRLDVTIAGRRYRRGRFATKAEAHAAVIELQARANQRLYGLPGARGRYTLGDLLRRREADPRAVARRQALQALRWFVGFLGAGTLLSDLSRASFLAFREHLERARPRKTSTIQQYLNSVGTALKAATDYWPDLDWRPPAVPQQRINRGRERTLTAAELRAILAALDGPRERYESAAAVRRRQAAADLIRLALVVPARRGELLALTPAAINLDWATILIDSTKTGTARTLILSQAALLILRRRWPEKGSRFFTLTPKQLITALQKAGAAATIPYGDNIEGGWVFHDLRHTAASALAAGGIDHGTIAYLLGHTAGGITHRYTHPLHASQQRAAAVLDAFLASIDDGILTGAEGRIVSFGVV